MSHGRGREKVEARKRAGVFDCASSPAILISFSARLTSSTRGELTASLRPGELFYPSRRGSFFSFKKSARAVILAGDASREITRSRLARPETRVRAYPRIQFSVEYAASRRNFAPLVLRRGILSSFPQAYSSSTSPVTPGGRRDGFELFQASRMTPPRASIYKPAQFSLHSLAKLPREHRRSRKGRISPARTLISSRRDSTLAGSRARPTAPHRINFRPAGRTVEVTRSGWISPTGEDIADAKITRERSSRTL